MSLSNYPPGVSDAPYQKGVYKYSCEDHATSYGHGYMELGGFYLEDDAVALCPEAVDGEWVHVYASRNRPISPTWASVPQAHYVHDDWGKTGVHTWVVTPEPVSDKKIFDYELTWAHGPLIYDEAPALPKFWWLEEEPCQQLELL